MTGSESLLDDLVPIAVILGVGYAIVVWIGSETGLAAKWPSLFGPRARPLAIACWSFGGALFFAGRDRDDAASGFYAIAGWFLVLLGAFLWTHRNAVGEVIRWQKARPKWTIVLAFLAALGLIVCIFGGDTIRAIIQSSDAGH